MKKETIVSLIALLILSINLNASNILEEGKIWILGATSPTADGEFSMFFCGDTIIENQIYKKMYWNEVAQGHYYGGLREDNNRIYYKFPDENWQELLLYDFNLNVNDTFNVYVNQLSNPLISKVVTSITAEFEFGKERQIYYFNDGDKWIEDIGSIYGLVYHNPFAPILKGYIEDGIIIYCDSSFFFYDCDDFLLMHNCNITTPIEEVDVGKLKLYPNPTAELLTIDLSITHNSKEGDMLMIYDVSGNQVYSQNVLKGELTTIDIAGLSNGLYYISVKGGYNYMSKFVKI